LIKSAFRPATGHLQQAPLDKLLPAEHAPHHPNATSPSAICHLSTSPARNWLAELRLYSWLLQALSIHRTGSVRPGTRLRPCFLDLNKLGIGPGAFLLGWRYTWLAANMHAFQGTIISLIHARREVIYHRIDSRFAMSCSEYRHHLRSAFLHCASA
jgi:hypothetical protein